MPEFPDEQTIKRPSEFTKLQQGDVVSLTSNLARVITHYLDSQKKTVICKRKGCEFCSQGLKPRIEYYYTGVVNGEECTIQMPGGCFFDMNELESQDGLSKRNFTWLISREAQEDFVKYGATRKEKIEPLADVTVEKNNEALMAHLEKYEKRMISNYDDAINMETFSEPK